MKKWIKISATLLPMMFIGCTEHSLDSHGLSNEEVHIQFAARPEINYEIDVVTRAKDNEYSMGLVGVAVTEKDSAADCLAGLNVYDFCRTLVNTEFTGVLDGCIYPVDGVQRTFPFEKGSAMAVYAYLPYRNTEVEIGDTSCYINIDLKADEFAVDYMYTGKVFRDKATYTPESVFELPFKHAFAKVNFNFSSGVFKELGHYVQIDTLAISFMGNGKGRLDLKNGNFYPERTSSKESYRVNLADIKYLMNSGVHTSASSVLYIPPGVLFKSIRLVVSVFDSRLPLVVELPFEKDVELKRGYEYTISFKYKEQSKVTIKRE
ncbi:MAG: fimbrillin family protein [Bacteroidaceae bacterium]|nr:fimbrillin family protein [Bacteroidaceae bacterium]